MGKYTEDAKELLKLVGGIPGLLSIQPQFMGSFALAMLVAIAVPFLLTTIVGKRKGVGLSAIATDAGTNDLPAFTFQAGQIAKAGETIIATRV